MLSSETSLASLEIGDVGRPWAVRKCGRDIPQDGFRYSVRPVPNIRIDIERHRSIIFRRKKI